MGGGFTFGHVFKYAPSCSPCPPAQKLKLTSFWPLPKRRSLREQKSHVFLFAHYRFSLESAKTSLFLEKERFSHLVTS
ncbi:MAG: hypothetical protein A2007_06360 [Verrucomicrobia bacterium GWC2_42_7]|nr:MAG: hypothetical protein A2007_06360 [Verrucomicrobia bacterium GWC2_42_7]